MEATVLESVWNIIGKKSLSVEEGGIFGVTLRKSCFWQKKS